MPDDDDKNITQEEYRQRLADARRNLANKSEDNRIDELGNTSSANAAFQLIVGVLLGIGALIGLLYFIAQLFGGGEGGQP